MSELTILAGGVIEVDTESLREAASRLRSLSEQTDDAIHVLRGAPERLAGVAGQPPAEELYTVGVVLADAAELAADLAAAVDQAADLYEAVEMLAQRAAARAAGDDAAVARWDERIAAARPDDPDLWLEAQELLAKGPERGDLSSQAWLGSLGAGPFVGSLVPVLLSTLRAGVDALRLGPVGTRERLRGAGDPVAIRRMASAPSLPPATLAAAATRIPGGGDARVRVERYTMPGGARQFAVYVAGTQSVAGADPFDLRSNVQLYGGERSASYRAALAALEDAGAEPGDVVHVFGYSQGAMVGERLALEGPFETRTLVSFGAPIQADVASETLAVTIRHTDDPVAALQGGGHPVTVGAPGSFVVERTADAAAGWHDLTVPAHEMTAYAETAALLDASDDPRAAGLHAVFRDLGEAERGVGGDYAAERVSLSGSGGTERRGSR